MASGGLVKDIEIGLGPGGSTSLGLVFEKDATTPTIKGWKAGTVAEAANKASGCGALGGGNEIVEIGGERVEGLVYADFVLAVKRHPERPVRQGPPSGSRSSGVGAGGTL